MSELLSALRVLLSFLLILILEDEATRVVEWFPLGVQASLSSVVLSQGLEHFHSGWLWEVERRKHLLIFSPWAI